jgi:hypothetical protein
MVLNNAKKSSLAKTFLNKNTFLGHNWYAICTSKINSMVLTNGKTFDTLVVCIGVLGNFSKLCILFLNYINDIMGYVSIGVFIKLYLVFI